MKLEYSSIALKGNDYKEKIKEARAFCEKNEVEFGIQMHNTANLDEVELLSKENVPLSFHAPIGGKHYINLATRNIKTSIKSLEDTLLVMEKYNVNLAVFHGFLLVDNPVPTITERTDEAFVKAIQAAFREDLLYSKEKGVNPISNIDFKSDEYQERLGILKENLAYIDKKYEGFNLCIENDFPVYSFGSLLADYISKFNHKICLDTGHLWGTCVLYNLDVIKEAEKILKTGNVLCTHFHNSLLKKDSSPLEVRDGHQNLYIESDVPLKDILKLMLQYNVNDYIFEIITGDLKDFETFINWKNEILGK